MTGGAQCKPQWCRSRCVTGSEIWLSGLLLVPGSGLTLTVNPCSRRGGLRVRPCLSRNPRLLAANGFGFRHSQACAGEVTATGILHRRGSVEAISALSWPEQQAAGISPIIIRAHYGAGAHHPHLQGGTVGDWPLHVFDEREADGGAP